MIWRAVKRIGIILAAFLVCAIIWGAAIEPRFIARVHETSQLPHLPSAWEGKQILFFADLQVGMWLANKDAIREVVSQAIALHPRLVLIGGDFVYNPTEDEREDVELDEFEDVDEDIREVVSILQPLGASGVPVYGVLGNHDYGMMERDSLRNDLIARRLKTSLGRIGIRILDNESAVVQGLHIVGIGSHMAGYDKASAALENVPADAPRIVIMHHPDSYWSIPAGAAPLAIAGHTHGGQIRIPFLPHWSWLSLVRDTRVDADGWIRRAEGAGNRLYINIGIGFSRLPVRINCQPELTIFTLRR